MIIILTNSSFSQKLSISGSAGYNFPIATRFNPFYQNNSIELIKSTYSEGITFKAGVSYFIFENIGLDFSILYLFEEKEKSVVLWVKL